MPSYNDWQYINKNTTKKDIKKCTKQLESVVISGVLRYNDIKETRIISMFAAQKNTCI